MKLSNYLSLNVRDILHGFFVAFVGAILSGIVAILDAHQLPNAAQLKDFALIGLTAGVSYVLKNVFQNNQGDLLKTDK